MKKILVSVVLAVFLLSGCSVSFNSKPSQTPTPTTVSAESQFLADAKRTMPDLESVPDADLIATGRKVCDTLDAGKTIEQIMTESLAAGVDGQVTGTIVGAAVKDFCPEYTDAVRGFLQKYGGSV